MSTETSFLAKNVVTITVACVGALRKITTKPNGRGPFGRGDPNRFYIEFGALTYRRGDPNSLCKIPWESKNRNYLKQRFDFFFGSGQFSPNVPREK